MTCNASTPSSTASRTQVSVCELSVCAVRSSLHRESVERCGACASDALLGTARQRALPTHPCGTTAATNSLQHQDFAPADDHMLAQPCYRIRQTFSLELQNQDQSQISRHLTSASMSFVFNLIGNLPLHSIILLVGWERLGRVRWLLRIPTHTAIPWIEAVSSSGGSR